MCRIGRLGRAIVCPGPPTTIAQPSAMPGNMTPKFHSGVKKDVPFSQLQELGGITPVSGFCFADFDGMAPAGLPRLLFKEYVRTAKMNAPATFLVETVRDRVETVVETVVFYCRDRRDR